MAGLRRFGVEREVVRVAEVAEVGNDVGKGVRGGVPTVQDVDGAAVVVGAVEHVGDEDAVVWRSGHESGAAEALDGDVDGEVRRELEGDSAAVGEMDGVGGEGLCGAADGAGENKHGCESEAASGSRNEGIERKHWVMRCRFRVRRFGTSGLPKSPGPGRNEHWG